MDLKKRRSEFRSKYLYRFYSPYFHIASNFLFPVFGIAISMFYIKTIEAHDLIWPIFFFFYISFFIYYSHRYQQHRKVKGLSNLFEFHTVEHHSLFNPENMIKEKAEDAYMILTPPSTVFILVVFFFPLFSLVFYFLFGMKVALLYYSSSCLYYFLYDFIHLLSHTSENNFYNKIPIFKKLTLHHKAHHHPALMSKYNFGIVTTFWDYIFKTKYKD